MTYQFYFGDIWAVRHELLEGTLMTLRLTVTALILSILFATPLAVARRSGPAWLRGIVYAYVEYIRNTPFLVQIFFLYFGLGSAGFRLSPNVAALAAMVLNGTAYTIEIVRAGIASINSGQREAAFALGIHPIRAFLSVILPQALRVVFVPLGNEFILLMLGSSVVSVIAATELSAVTHDVSSRTFRAFESYIAAALIYLSLTIVFSILFRVIYRIMFRPEARA
jgi:polar amino acid transport system permease protein